MKRITMTPLERLREIASVFGLAGGNAETSWFDASNPVCRDAEKLLRAGRAAEAEEIFRKVLEEPRYASLAKKHLPRILLALATAQLRQKKWEAADQSAARAWALLSELKYRSTPEYAECCRLRAEAAKGRGACEDALRLFLQGLAAVESQKHARPPDIVEYRVQIAGLLREMERHAEAERMAASAVELAERELDGSRHYGDACLEWALCLAACERYDEARKAGERAADVHRSACGAHSDELAQDYEKLGSICQKQEDYPAAVSYLEKALGIRERQVGGDTSEMALLMVALADLYSLIGRLAPALELLQQAVGKLGPAKDGHLAGALEKLGSVYVRTGRYEDAAGCFQRAYDFWASSPEDYADRILANRQAYENLLPWLPEPAAPRPKPEAPDPGISVLREPGGPGSVPPPAPGARMEVPAPLLPVPNLAPASSMPAPQAGISSPLPVEPAQAAILTPPAVPVYPQSAAGATGVPSSEPPVPAAPAPAAPSASTASMLSLNAALQGRQDAQGFCGWEELEFDRITVPGR
jgi:tetratricopeptide (TPR) repeat protein